VEIHLEVEMVEMVDLLHLTEQLLLEVVVVLEDNQKVMEDLEDQEADQLEDLVVVVQELKDRAQV
jgi:hypothetical protein